MQILFKFPCLQSFLEMPQNPHVLLTFEEVHNPLRLPHETTSEPPKVVRSPSVFNILTSKCGATTAYTFSTLQLPKVVRQCCVLYILTSKRASRHNRVHFFDISISRSGLTLRCFVHFHFEMCFAPRRRAIFHLSWQAGSAPAALASLLFDPPEPQIIGKTQCFATFLPFAHLHLLSSDSFSSPIFSLLLSSSLCLCPAWLFICPYCRKFDF